MNLIAGGGPAGLTLALALQRANQPALVFEPEAPTPSYALQLAPNATAVLKSLKLEVPAIHPQRVEIRRARTNRAFARIPLTHPNHALVTRHRLLAALRGALAPNTIKPHRITHSAVHAHGVSITLDDTTTIKGDTLLLADGIASQTGQSFLPVPPQRTGTHIVKRALIPNQTLPPPFKDQITVWTAFLRHVVLYPVPNGINIVAIAPRSMSNPFARFPEPTSSFLSHTTTHPLTSRAHAPHTAHARAALLGDAAHPMLPSLAQGAACALEDASCLAHYLASSPPTEALASYARTRRPQTRGRVKLSRLAHVSYHLPPPLPALLYATGIPQRRLARIHSTPSPV